MIARQITCCNFCGLSQDNVAWLFAAHAGGTPSAICDRCITKLAGVIFDYNSAAFAARPKISSHDAAMIAAQATFRYVDKNDHQLTGRKGIRSVEELAQWYARHWRDHQRSRPLNVEASPDGSKS